MRNGRSSPPSVLCLVLLFAALFAHPFCARGDTLVDIGFEVFGPFSKDTDPNSDATFTRWGMDEPALDPAYGNPPHSAFARTTYSTVGEARTNDQVFRFTLTPQSGYTISLSSVSFDIAALRRATSASDQIVQMFGYTDRDGQATPVAAGFAIDSTSGDGPSLFSTFSTDLSGNSLYQNVGGPIVFSFYVVGSNATDFAYFDNIRVTGTTAAVPEPSTYALIGMAGAALIGRAARRRMARR